MTLNLVVIGVATMAMFILLLLGMITELGFLVVASMVTGLLLDAEILSVGVGNLVWGALTLSSTDGTVLLILMAVFVIVQAGILIRMRERD